MNFEIEPHKWVKFPGVGRERCCKCGLLALHNPLTAFCIRYGCDHTDHPRYKRMCETLGKG